MRRLGRGVVYLDIEWPEARLAVEVDGAGLVHLCQPKTGSPAKPLAEYSVEDIRRQFDCGKLCSARCPIAYAHLGSRLDGFRRQQSAQA